MTQKGKFIFPGKLLCKSWGTGLLAPPDMFKQMTVVELPEGVIPKESMPSMPEDEQRPKCYEYKHAVLVQNALHYDYKVEVGVYAFV